MPGFAREEQQLLACLVGAHRRKIALLPAQDLIPPWDRKAPFLVLPLRLAVLAHRGRGPAPLPAVKLTPRGRSLTLEFPRRWLKDHPLTVADLLQEVEYWKSMGFRLRVFNAKPGHG